MTVFYVFVAAAAVLLAIEVLTTDMVFGSLSIGAFVGGLASLVLPLPISGGVAIAAALASLAFIRPAVKRALNRTRGYRPEHEVALANATPGTVIAAIDGGDRPGIVRWASNEWTAVSASGDPIPAGTRVYIDSIENGITLTVTPTI